MLLTQEFAQIRQKNTKINENNVTTSTKEKRKKVRRKTIVVTSNIDKLST